MLCVYWDLAWGLFSLQLLLANGVMAGGLALLVDVRWWHGWTSTERAGYLLLTVIASGLVYLAVLLALKLRFRDFVKST